MLPPAVAGKQPRLLMPSTVVVALSCVIDRSVSRQVRNSSERGEGELESAGIAAAHHVRRRSFWGLHGDA